MKKAVCVILATFFITFSIAVGQSNTTTRYLKFSGIEDDQTATSKIYNVLKANGETVEKMGKTGEMLSLKGEIATVILMPKMKSAGELNRITFEKYWRVKFQYKHTDAIKELVWNANRQVNTGSYSLDSDGDLLIKGSLPFLDTLDLILLKKYSDWFVGTSLYALGMIDDNYLEYFE